MVRNIEKNAILQKLLALYVLALTSMPLSVFATTIPSTVHCIYSYLSGQTRQYNYVDIPTPSTNVKDALNGGSWITTSSEKQAYEIKDQNKALNLANLCSTVIEQKYMTYSPRFEEVRVSSSSFFSTSAGWLFSSVISYATKPGYPIFVGREDGSSVRLNIEYVEVVANSKKKSDLSRSVLFSNELSRPAIRQIKIENISVASIVKSLVHNYGVQKVAEEAGKMASIKVKALLYQKPGFCVRNSSDNSVNSHLYVASVNADTVGNLLKNLGVDLDAMFNVHPSVNWMLNIIKNKIQIALAHVFSESVGVGIEKLTAYATEKALYAMIDNIEKKVKNRTPSENLPIDIDREIEKMDKEIDLALNDVLLVDGHVSTENLPAGLDKQSAQLIGEHIANEVNREILGSQKTLSSFGGIKKIEYFRNHIPLNSSFMASKDKSITIGDVVSAKFAEIKVKLHVRLHQYIRESIQYSFIEMSKNATRQVTAGTLTFTTLLSPVIGPQFVIVGGGLTMADVMSGNRATNYIGEQIGDYFGKKVADYIENTNLPLPNFLSISEKDLQLIYRADHYIAEDGTDFFLMPDSEKNPWGIQMDGPYAPTIQNYLVQQADSFSKTVNSSKERTISKLQDAKECIASNLQKFYSWCANKWTNTKSPVELSKGEDEEEDDEDDEEYFDPEQIFI